MSVNQSYWLITSHKLESVGTFLCYFYLKPSVIYEQLSVRPGSTLSPMGWSATRVRWVELSTWCQHRDTAVNISQTCQQTLSSHQTKYQHTHTEPEQLKTLRLQWLRMWRDLDYSLESIIWSAYSGWWQLAAVHLNWFHTAHQLVKMLGSTVAIAVPVQWWILNGRVGA